jgi:vanillate O-demethylase ferredoxin subunit
MRDAFQEQRLVRVAGRRPVALDVVCLDLKPADRRPLEPFEPGAHVDLFAPNGQMRQYSLCGDPGDASRYVIAVKREAAGRGGSASMHDDVEVGTALGMQGPRNFFPLAPQAAHSIFIAGGIGITPIRAMIAALAAAGASWELHYCARSEAHAAFYAELAALAPERVKPYFSEAPLLDAAALLREVRRGAHVYCCGPEPLMKAVEKAAAHWPEGTVHFEWFAAPKQDWPENRAFTVECARSGLTLEVPAARTILQVVREQGIDVVSACEEGVCGTCETRVLEGVPEHRDVLLTPAEREAGASMMICISRAKTQKLVLDL